MFKKGPWKDVCKFLAGALFVSAGAELYLYAVGVLVPFGSFMITPEKGRQNQKSADLSVLGFLDVCCS
jgi:hypothetical protein